MCRVELKEEKDAELVNCRGLVPNVPCGVESFSSFGLLFDYHTVPNVPCGVESVVKKPLLYAHLNSS